MFFLKKPYRLYQSLKYWFQLCNNLRKFSKNFDIHKSRIDWAISRLQSQLMASKSQVKEVEDALLRIREILTLETSANLIRVGGPFDAGYVIYSLPKLGFIFSAGIGKNAEFEDYFAEQGVPLVACDPTISNYPSQKMNSLIDFQQKWVVSSLNCDHRTKICLAEYPRSTSLKGKQRLLKMDIEENEWDILYDDWESVIEFDQLVLEFHGVHKMIDSDLREKAKFIFEVLGEHFKCIAFHSNNWAPFINFGSVFVPDIFEITLLRNEHFSVGRSGNYLNVREFLTDNNPKYASIPNEIIQYVQGQKS